MIWINSDTNEKTEGLTCEILSNITIACYSFDFVDLTKEQDAAIKEELESMGNADAWNIPMFIVCLRSNNVVFEMKFKASPRVSEEENEKILKEVYLPFYREMLDLKILV